MEEVAVEAAVEVEVAKDSLDMRDERDQIMVVIIIQHIAEDVMNIDQDVVFTRIEDVTTIEDEEVLIKDHTINNGSYAVV